MSLALSDITLIMLVGPSAIGKSTLMNEIVKQDEQFSRVKSFTTRPPRDNDEPGQYFYLSDAERSQLANSKQIVTDVMAPTTGYHYGSMMQSYVTKFVLLDAFASSVESYERLPFKRTCMISITSMPSSWKRRFLSRYPVPSDEARHRLAEGIMSIEWSLGSHDTMWVMNEGPLNDSAANIISLIAGSAKNNDESATARDLLHTMKQDPWS